MPVLLVKSSLTTLALLLAAFQVLTQLQLRGKMPGIMPFSKMTLRALHRWGGDLILLLVVGIALICIYTQGWQAYDVRGAAHIVLGALAGLVLLVKVLIARLRRRWIGKLGLGLGFAAGLFIAAVWSLSALWYFLFQSGWI